MKLDKKLMKICRSDLEKAREIFRTARTTDMERQEARSHLQYLGNDSLRYATQYDQCGVEAIALGGTLIVGAVGAYAFGLHKSMPVIEPLLFASSLFMIAHNRLRSPYFLKNRNYSDALEESRRNIETHQLRAQNTQ